MSGIKEGRLVQSKILIVEDDQKIARIVELQLQHSGYKVEKVFDGETAFQKIKSASYALILLDIMLPKINGLELCRKIRSFSQIPIIMLTAKDDVTDKIIGLDFGANDYVTKPFDMEELLARIRVQLRVPVKENDPSQIKIEDLEICLSTYKVSRGGKSINLTKKEFDLLVFLAENRGIVLSREKILEKVWGYDYFGNDNVLDVYIKYIRDKIDKPFNIKLIETVRGVGYVIR